jgi:hypothetical protein
MAALDIFVTTDFIPNLFCYSLWKTLAELKATEKLAHLPFAQWRMQ